MQFISSENGYGVTSLVEKLIVNEFLLLKHSADTQDDGSRERDKEWTGGEESYLLSEKNGITTLTARFNVPIDMEDYFKVNYPIAMEKVKSLAEKNRDAKV